MGSGSRRAAGGRHLVLAGLLAGLFSLAPLRAAHAVAPDAQDAGGPSDGAGSVPPPAASDCELQVPTLAEVRRVCFRQQLQEPGGYTSATLLGATLVLTSATRTWGYDLHQFSAPLWELSHDAWVSDDRKLPLALAAGGRHWLLALGLERGGEGPVVSWEVSQLAPGERPVLVPSPQRPALDARCAGMPRLTDLRAAEAGLLALRWTCDGDDPSSGTATLELDAPLTGPPALRARAPVAVPVAPTSAPVLGAPDDAPTPEEGADTWRYTVTPEGAELQRQVPGRSEAVPYARWPGAAQADVALYASRNAVVAVDRAEGVLQVLRTELLTAAARVGYPDASRVGRLVWRASALPDTPLPPRELLVLSRPTGDRSGAWQTRLLDPRSGYVQDLTTGECDLGWHPDGQSAFRVGCPREASVELRLGPPSAAGPGWASVAGPGWAPAAVRGVAYRDTSLLRVSCRPRPTELKELRDPGDPWVCVQAASPADPDPTGAATEGLLVRPEQGAWMFAPSPSLSPPSLGFEAGLTGLPPLVPTPYAPCATIARLEVGPAYAQIPLDRTCAPAAPLPFARGTPATVRVETLSAWGEPGPSWEASVVSPWGILLPAGALLAATMAGLGSFLRGRWEAHRRPRQFHPTGEPILDPRWLHGKAVDVRERVLTEILDGARLTVWTGERRSGKTSVLEQVRARLVAEPRRPPVVVAATSCNTEHDPVALRADIVRVLARALHLRGVTTTDELLGTLRSLKRSRRIGPVVLLLDEAQDLYPDIAEGTLDPRWAALRGWVRGLAQTSDVDLRLGLCGVHLDQVHAADERSGAGSHLLNIQSTGSWHRLGACFRRPTEAGRLLDAGGEARGYTFTPEARAWLLELAGQQDLNMLRTQQLGRWVAEVAATLGATGERSPAAPRVVLGLEALRPEIEPRWNDEP